MTSFHAFTFYALTFQMGLIIYMRLLLLTPKVLNLPFDTEDAFLSWAHPMLHSTIGLTAGSAERSPPHQVEDFPWWVSLLQGKDFLQLCDDI